MLFGFPFRSQVLHQTSARSSVPTPALLRFAGRAKPIVEKPPSTRTSSSVTEADDCWLPQLIQYAKHIGVRTINIVRRQEQVQQLKDLG